MYQLYFVDTKLVKKPLIAHVNYVLSEEHVLQNEAI